MKETIYSWSFHEINRKKVCLYTPRMRYTCIWYWFVLNLLFLIKYLGKQNIADTIRHYEMTGLFKNVQPQFIILFFITPYFM